VAYPPLLSHTLPTLALSHTPHPCSCLIHFPPLLLSHTPLPLLSPTLVSLLDEGDLVVSEDVSSRPRHY
jgi:hypothetical protein